MYAQLINRFLVGLLPGWNPVGVGENSPTGAALQFVPCLGGDSEAGGHLDELEAAGADDERRALQDRTAVVAGWQAVLGLHGCR